MKERPLQTPQMPSLPTEQIPERFLEKAARYERLLRAVLVPGWELVELSRSFHKGASVYGIFHYAGGLGVVRGVKVRLSDHIGRWSEFDLDLRDPKERDMESLIKCLRSRSG